MRHSEGVMGKFGTVFVSFVVLCSSVSLSECKRSACWRYGHSCWGGHGKRSGVGVGVGLVHSESVPGIQSNIGNTGGLGTISLGSEGQNQNQLFGVLDKATGKFIPFPLLSMMMRARYRESFGRPGPAYGLSPNAHLPTFKNEQQPGQRLIEQGLMKIKRGGPGLPSGFGSGSAAGGGYLYGKRDLAREKESTEENTSGISLDQSISKEDDLNRSDKSGQYDTDFTKETSEEGRQLSENNAIFVRSRKASQVPLSLESSQSIEQANSANEEESDESASSLRNSQEPRFQQNRIILDQRTM